MSKETMKVFASLTDLDGPGMDKMTKAELKHLLRTFLSELDHTVQSISKQAPNINPKFDINVAASLALAPLVCLLDKYVQVIEPKVAKAFRHNAMEYLNKLCDDGVIQMEEPKELKCSSCKKEIMIMENNSQETVPFCTVCVKRVNQKEEKVRQ